MLFDRYQITLLKFYITLKDTIFIKKYMSMICFLFLLYFH